MKKEHSLGKKLFALILSGILVLSSIPIALATDNSTKDEPNSAVGAKATADEAVGDDEYPKLTVNSDATTYKNSDGLLYVKASTLTKLTIEFDEGCMHSELDPASVNLAATENELSKFKFYIDSDDPVQPSSISNSKKIYKAEINVDGSSLKTGYHDIAGYFTTDEGEVFRLFGFFGVYYVGDDDAPVISNVSKNGTEGDDGWYTSEVELTFDVNSTVPLESVSVIENYVDEYSAVSLGGSSYKYELSDSDSGSYKIKAKDVFGTESEYDLGEILIDTDEPDCIEVIYYDGANEVMGWSNKSTLTAKAMFMEDTSIITDGSITVNGSAPLNVIRNSDLWIVEFAVESGKDYTIAGKDLAGNEFSVTIEAKDIPIDSVAPADSDFTLTFDTAETAADKILNVLSFGTYSNTGLKVKVDVDSNGGSAIDPASVKLYYGATEFEKQGEWFIIPESMFEDTSFYFDLNVEAADLAGNSSGKINFNDKNSKVKAKVAGDGENIRAFDSGYYELICSKVVPENTKFEITGTKIKTIGETTYVSGDDAGVVIIIKEQSTGINALDVTLDGTKVTPTYKETDTTKKIEEQTAEYSFGELTEGEHTVEFTATANSGMSDTKSMKFTYVKSGPKQDGNVTLSNMGEGGAQEWRNANVSGTVKFSENPVPVKKVTYYNSTLHPTPGASDIKDAVLSGEVWTFTAEEYGEYTITAYDELDNTTTITTDTVLIDKAVPEVVGDNFSYDTGWTNGGFDVEFEVKDNPENNSGITSVTVDGEAISFEGGKCKFTADHYGDYEIKITDAATNVKTKNLKIENFDDITPVVSEVNFATPNSVKSYGVYANAPITMTVTLTDPTNTDGVCSGIDSSLIELREDGSALTPDSVSASGGNATLIYTVNTSDDIRAFTFFAVDNAGNEQEYKLINNQTIVTADNTAKDCEVVATLLSPAIPEMQVEFTKGPTPKDGKNYYSGKGKFTTSITDEVSGIDAYKVYFTETSNVTFDGEGNVTAVAGDPRKSVSGISKNKKVTSVPEVYVETAPAESLKSGEYTAVVWAKNLSGNEFYRAEKVVVDNTAPQITSFEITTAGADDTIGKYGVYSASPVTVKMVYSDDPCSVGIKSTQFYNGTEKLGDGTSDTVTLSDNGSYQISALVTDLFDNALESAQDIKTVPVKVNGNPVSVDSQNFEIVVNSDNKALKYSSDKPAYDFDYSNGKNIFKSNTDGKGNITASVENTLSGIKSLTAGVKNRDTNASETVSVQLTDTQTDDFNKVTAQTLTVDASKLASGSYHVVFTAVDMGGVVNTLEGDFYIDKTVPTYNGMSIGVANPSVADRVLNVLTFGLYSNDSLEVTVTFTDPGPSAGMDTMDIVLSCEGAKKIDAKSFEETPNGDYGDKEYKKVFLLRRTEDDAEKDMSFYNDLQLEYKDVYDNSSAKQAPTNVTANGDTITLDGAYDIAATALAPKITNTELTGNNEFIDTSDRLWFSNNPTFIFTATDDVSKLHSMEVKVNGTDVTTSCTYNGGTPYTESFTTFDGLTGKADKNVPKIDVTLDTANIAEVMKEGKNTISVTITGNNSESSSFSCDVYVDTQKPVVQRFDFSDFVTQDGDNSAKANGVKNTDYGYFFADNTTVTVTATDNIMAGAEYSGVKEISLFTKDINGTFKKRAMISRSGDAASFAIEANFKGQLYAYAVDNVENNRNADSFTPSVSDASKKVFTPDSVIVETEAQHKAYSGVAVTPVTAPAGKDNSGEDLYKGDVTVNLEAHSTYAGIKTVEYIVDSAYDQNGNNRNRDITDTVNKNGAISGGWTVTGTENNLVTSVKKSIVVSNNSNDIKVKVIVTDRCGFKTEKETVFSIDKTAPHIDVQFSPADGNKVDNGDYYRTDRTATITVTERNFDPANFKFTITNTDGSIPSLDPGAGWNTSYGLNSDDPDATTHTATITFHADGDYNMESEYTDLAGNEADNNHKKEAEFTVDQTVPVVSITFDVNNSTPYYNVTRTATIRVEEHNFYSEYVDIKQTALAADNSTPKAAPAVSGWTTSGDVSTATITFADDGKYSFTVDFKDKALNDAVQQRAAEFYIDKKIDKIEIVNVEDLTAYDGTIAPEIRFFDNNYGTASYLLTRIDYNKPAAAVDSPTPAESSGGGYSKLVTYSDFERIPTNDGIYQLSADISDLAGNKEHKDVLFSVNRFGSTFLIDDKDTKELVEDKFYTNDAPDIIITEINVNEVSDPEIQINRDDSSQELKKDTDYTVSASGDNESWHAYDYKVFKKNFDNEGNYTVVVSSTDHFKNTVSNKTAYKSETENRTCPVSFVVDKTAPIITISGIDNDEYYGEAEKDVIVNCDDANITSEDLDVELDGEKFTDFEKNETSGNVELTLSLQADGNDKQRTFEVKITDKAGNVSDNGEVHGFILGASWIARLFRYHLPIVIIVGALVLAGIVFAVIMAVRKNKKKAS